MPRVKRFMDFQVKCVREENPYKKGSHKWRLLNWALEAKEFSRKEFFAAEKRIFVETEQLSQMTDETRTQAWWNEFFNKYRDFEMNE